jgi:hypothetical protein
MAEVQNAMQMKRNRKSKRDQHGVNSFTQPIQFLPKIEKDDDWTMHNIDWLEWQGVQQIEHNARRLMKNYNLAKGVLDKNDYIPDEEPSDTSDLVDMLSRDTVKEDSTTTALDLKFYPIIPNVIDVLVTEFSKRNTKIDYRGVDEYTTNEVKDRKTAEIEEVLLEDAMSKLQQKMIDAGMDPNSPEAQEQYNPDTIKQLPHIQEFYAKSFVTIGEEWAAKQHEVDSNRFKMDELEEIGFRDMLITDREFWHFRMLEDDYDIELWNPVLTFYHKSPEARYISEGSWVGKIDMLTISDVIDKYGPQLTQEQLEVLEGLHPVRAGRYLLDGVSKDSYYNPTISHEDNLKESLQMKRWRSFERTAYNPDDVISWIIGESEEYGKLEDGQMMRVTTAYWKTQRKVGYLTSINEGGETTNDIIDESYVIANNPIYFDKHKGKRSAETLISGDHIEWIWINQVYGGVKIGPNTMLSHDLGETDDYSPIYIGIESNKIGPMRFQFKGDNNLYGSKLPVEGKIFTERNTRSTALVDLMKPAQIGYNLVNNQIADILIDEIGVVIALDQNALPQKSLGETWGKGNYAKAYVAMKDYNILPLDTSLMNTENAINFQHYQQLNLEETNRLMSRVQMANFFKNQAMEVVGMNPQRLGQQIGQNVTATEVEQTMVGSFAQTEKYFIQHSDYLMPRVHKMRTDLAQYYHSKRPSVRMDMATSPDERAFFEVNGIDLLMLDINVFCMTNANSRALMEKIQQLIMTNNTSGATIYELGEAMQSNSLGTLNNKLKEMDAKAQQKAEQDHQRAKELQEAEAQARQQELKMEQDFEARESEKKNRKDLMVAEIKAAGYGAMQDIDQNLKSDFQDTLDNLKQTEQYQETMNFEKEKEGTKKNLAERKLDIEQQKVDVAREDSQNKVRIAKENKTASEINAKKNKKNK